MKEKGLLRTSVLALRALCAKPKARSRHRQQRGFPSTVKGVLVHVGPARLAGWRSCQSSDGEFPHDPES
eukprot:908012-Prorocentrum_lima.AAC.1